METLIIAIIYTIVVVLNNFKAKKSHHDPISWIHEKMIWLVKELQNPKENV